MKSIVVVALTTSQVAALLQAASYVYENSGMDGDHTEADGRRYKAAADALARAQRVTSYEFDRYDYAAGDLLDADPVGARDHLGTRGVKSARSFRQKVTRAFGKT